MAIMSKLGLSLVGVLAIAGSALAEGEFDLLSTGNQTIADALCGAQPGGCPAVGGGDTWTRDQIAAEKGDTGWGQIFQRMQEADAFGAEGPRNLGEVVSTYQHENNPAATKSQAVITTGTGQKVTVGKKSFGGSDDVSGTGAKSKGKGGDATTAGDGAVHGHGGVVGAGVTTAGGGHGSVTIGKGSGVTTAGGAAHGFGHGGDKGGGVTFGGGVGGGITTGAGAGGPGNAFGKGKK